MSTGASHTSQTVHLVNFAAKYRGVEDRTTPPFGCLYVGGQLRKAGFSVIIHHIGSADLDATVKAICESPKPLFAGFSVLTGSPVAMSAKLSRKLKNRLPDLPIVWGGVHSSLAPDSCLSERAVNFVVRGEGEITAVELADQFALGMICPEKITGLSWKDVDGTIRHNDDRLMHKDIDDFQLDWSLVDPRHYVKTALDGTPYISFIASRGCPFKCGFCYNLAFNKRRWRGHSPERVIQDLLKLRNATGVTRVTFYDDNFMANQIWSFQVLKGLRRIGMEPIWIEVRLDRFTDDLLSLLKLYGVRTIFVGWESGSDQTLARIEKGFKRELVLKAFELAAKHGFDIDASAIVGFPFEKIEDWRCTISTAIEIDRINPGRNKFNIGVYVPYPGTTLLKEALENGFRFPSDIDGWDDFDILNGRMRLPWLSENQIRDFMFADRYAKMLYMGGGSPLIKLFRGFFAHLARRRLRRFNFANPWEAALYDAMVRIYVRHKQNKIPTS
jgi:anaerobic magnesium-protoporphyrin IX monomethyl ester cyclase